jgi:hypothetical protein
LPVQPAHRRKRRDVHNRDHTLYELPATAQADCDTSLGTTDGRYHLSHRTIETIRDNPQSKGPRLYSISRGNETNLKEPVRVVMGERRIYDMQVLAYRRDQNNRDPDHGWFIALYEGCEGPVENISGENTGRPGRAERECSAHYGFALGYTPQTEIAEITSHGYPGTALISYNYGWIDPTTVGPSDAKANARFRASPISGCITRRRGGLLGKYYTGEDFEIEIKRRIDSTSNWPLLPSQPPVFGLSVGIRRRLGRADKATVFRDLYVQGDQGQRCKTDRQRRRRDR